MKLIAIMNGEGVSAAQQVTEHAQPLREELVSTAVKFLQNPRVSSRPRSEKEAFLQKKGLTNSEILAAFEASGTSNTADNNAVGHYSSVKVAQVHEYSHSMTPVPRTRWDILRDVLHISVLAAGAAYSLHYLYRKFIAPLLFGKKKKKSLTDTVEDMNKNLTSLVSDVSAAVQTLSDTVATLRLQQYEKSEIKELKAEMASLKALMLGRRQFPAPPTIVTGPPSIPAWQLGSTSGDSNLTEQKSKNHLSGTVSLSSSPEIISVEDLPSNSGSLSNPGLTSGVPARDPSESSESNSAEIVEMGASASGGSGEDTD
uniref:Peroxisomal membrane protein PEX14 n=1 Tax=Scapholeberis mucronata TaxID=202097 RepID=A0A4Y7NL13_9CRUS|nr:EOG090X0FQ8 [Scapholeberis mucronata]SVE93940.1 EOG090X0FQ8 [Scapholeberis mucronata]